MTELESGATDSPSSLDFEYQSVFGSERYHPISFVVMPPTIQNQGAQSITRMGCTRFGAAHVINAQNKARSDVTGETYQETEAIDFWKEYLKTNPSAEREGATLQSSLEQYRKAGKITGYAKVSTEYDMKDAIIRNRLIFTGSQVGDWSKVTKEHAYVKRTDGRIVGHAFCIVGYDETGWVAINSYGPENGVFHIPYDLTDTLFSRYSVTDYNDDEALSNYRKKIMEGITIEDAKKALEAKLWNGIDPQRPATREEVAAMILRAMQK